MSNIPPGPFGQLVKLGCQWWQRVRVRTRAHTCEWSMAQVIEGMEVVKKLENGKTDGRDRPVAASIIVDCGSLE